MSLHVYMPQREFVSASVYCNPGVSTIIMPREDSSVMHMEDFYLEKLSLSQGDIFYVFIVRQSNLSHINMRIYALILDNSQDDQTPTPGPRYTNQPRHDGP